MDLKELKKLADTLDDNGKPGSFVEPVVDLTF